MQNEIRYCTETRQDLNTGINKEYSSVTPKKTLKRAQGRILYCLQG